ncbi:MAG TPA: FAD-binding oxidoreductase [Thermoplasmata archaeon]|nr:FAD-binding oxidoreductase [Thermoplasmata archaeon]
MEKPRDALVLGAGISGCSLAFHLAQRGLVATVYDPRTPAAGATGRSAGLLTEQLWDRWDVDLVRETRKEYAELAAAYDPSAYRRTGFLRIATAPVAVELLGEAAARWRSWGIDVEEPRRSEIARLVPALNLEGIGAAVFTPSDGVVDPSSIATTYAEAARKGGATFDFGLPTVSLDHRDGVWELRTATGTIRAVRLVVAAGAWSKSIVRSVGHPLPLAPYRTQAALLKPPGPRGPDPPAVHDLDLDVYLRPELEGRLLAGDGTEDREADPESFASEGDETFLAHLAETMEQRFPAWRDSEVAGSWAGVCTATPDRRPVIGTLDGARSLYVIGGFNGFGVMRAAGAARRLADLIADGPSASGPLAPARPDRFPEPEVTFRPRPGFTVEAGDDPRY